jgi:hypothetical protein
MMMKRMKMTLMKSRPETGAGPLLDEGVRGTAEIETLRLRRRVR